MEFKLNEDQQMIHDLAKDFAETVLQPRIDEIEAGEMVEVSNGQKHPQLPHDIHEQLAECGFIGISFPEEYDGMGMGHVEQAIVIKELSRVSPSVGKCLDVYILGLEALDLYANHEQKLKYLAPCCRGEQTVSFAFTEPETGSDPKMLKTRLEKQADGTYKLNGVKRFISNAGYDGPCVLFALQKDEESGKDLVTGLVIDKFCEGYSISSPWEKIGYRGSEVYDIFLANTDPSLVFFEMDVYWAVMGQQDPVEYITKYADRIKVLHIKDRYVLGDSGMMNFEQIFKHFYANGHKDYFVEMEGTGSGHQFEGVKKSADYLLKSSFVK